jgi:hypothetical protein
MDPFTFIAIAASLGGGLLDAKGKSDQAQADAESLLTQAAIERLKAQDAVARGAIEEGRTRMAGSQDLSQTRADAAQSAVDTSSGTAASVFSAKRAVNELDALMVRSNAAREAWGHNVQADQYERSARNAQKQGQLGILGSFLGTAANLTRIGSASKGKA